VVNRDSFQPPDESAHPARSGDHLLTFAGCLEQLRREASFGEVDTGHYRCRYFRWGAGPPLLFIPGLALDATWFAMPMSLLRTQFTCIGYEMPTGIGDGASATGYRLRNLVSDLFVLLEHLHIERAYVLGYSFGSMIALGALAAQPRILPRGLLVGGFARRPLAWAEVLLGYFARYTSGRVADLPGYMRVVRRRNAENFASRPPDEFEHFCNTAGAAMLRTFAPRALLMHRTDLRSVLARITQPILLVHGDRDPLVSRAYQDELKQGLPNAALAEIENCGHYPQSTHPEIFAEIVRQFLTPATCPAEAACCPETSNPGS
jgi:pimeloyl-ACP methyl ester carboxylesterase